MGGSKLIASLLGAKLSEIGFLTSLPLPPLFFFIRCNVLYIHRMYVHHPPLKNTPTNQGSLVDRNVENCLFPDLSIRIFSLIPMSP